jgi:hypothetical protein
MMVAEKFLRAKRMDEHPRAPDEQWKRRRACETSQIYCISQPARAVKISIVTTV